MTDRTASPTTVAFRNLPAKNEAKAAAQSDFDARIRSALVERKAEPVASRPMLGDMPSYGRASFSDLVKAVALAIYDREDVPIDVDLGEFIGHQMVPRINFNSLNRIVSAFSTPPAAPVTAPMVLLRKVTDELEDVVFRNKGEWTDEVHALLNEARAMLSASPSPVDAVADEIMRAVFGEYDPDRNRTCYAPWKEVREKLRATLSTTPSPVGESRDGLIERLVKALSAFAEAADIFEREYGDKMKPDTGCNIKFSALCEARAVLASKEQQS